MACCDTPYSNYDLVGGDEEPSTLFPNDVATDTVKNTIGDITSGTNVSSLRTTYATLDDVVSGMLQISTATENTPTPTGDSFVFLDNNEDVKITSSYPGTIQAQHNRGNWNNGFFADGITQTNLLAYNPGATATFNGAFGITNENIVFTPSSITNTSPPSVNYNKSGITGTFQNWTTYTLNGSMTSGSSTGTVYSNFPYQNPTVGPSGKVYPTADFVRNVYKPLYVNQIEKPDAFTGVPGTEGYSGETSTNKIFSNTNIVYVPNHNYTHTIAVPFDPTVGGVYEYDRLFDLWSLVDFTSVAIDTTSAPYLVSSETAQNSTYHLITLDQNIQRVNVDVRLNK